jgi:hypothetical protein
MMAFTWRVNQYNAFRGDSIMRAAGRKGVILAFTGLLAAVTGLECLPIDGNPCLLPCDELEDIAGVLRNDEDPGIGWADNIFSACCPNKESVARPLTGTGDGNSQLLSEPNQPDDFGYEIEWNRVDKEIVLGLFVNAADPRGVSIRNLKEGDQITISSASGKGVFRHKEEVDIVLSFMGLIAGGAGLIDEDLGQWLDDAEQFAKEIFGEVYGSSEERTDASGTYLNGDKETYTNRQGGGIIVCLPEASGPLHSGSSKHQERWIPDRYAPRTDDNVPEHVKGKAFFFVKSVPENNTRPIGRAGEVYILAWDYDFKDNRGYYKVYVHIKQGEGG